jgi:hypothetical protein
MILFDFVLNLNRVYKVKRFIWCSKFIHSNYQYFSNKLLILNCHKIIQKEFGICFEVQNLYLNFG